MGTKLARNPQLDLFLDIALSLKPAAAAESAVSTLRQMTSLPVAAVVVNVPDVAVPVAKVKALAVNTKAIERLRKQAESIRAKANEAITRPRETNTRRRAGMAAQAERNALREIQVADTMARIADDIEAGNSTFAKVSTRKDIETLDDLLRSAMRRREVAGKMNYDADRVPTDDDALFADFPMVRYDSYAFLEMLNETKHIVALDVARKKVKSLAAGIDDYCYRSPTPEQEDALETVAKFAPKCTAAKYVLVEICNRNRLRKLGVSNTKEACKIVAAYLALRAGKQARNEAKAAERSLVGMKIPGFFPTPRAVIERMIGETNIQPGDRVLEPSAGKGDIVAAILAYEPEADITAIEYSQTLIPILKSVAANADVRCGDFLEYVAPEPFDIILMNPPFENGADMQHVRYAYDWLSTGGVLVAIMSAGTFFRQDQKATDFRIWLDSVGGTSLVLPDGSFKSSFRPTGVSTRLVVIGR